MLQQTIYYRLSPKFEEVFNKNSYGFRPRKNAHQAVSAAQEYLNDGLNKIIELDLEKFFDRVNHQKLLTLLSKTIADKRVLKLISTYLKSGIMEGGVVSQRLEGTPQGSPLSPLLSISSLMRWIKNSVNGGTNLCAMPTIAASMLKVIKQHKECCKVLPAT